VSVHDAVGGPDGGNDGEVPMFRLSLSSPNVGTPMTTPAPSAVPTTIVSSTGVVYSSERRRSVTFGPEEGRGGMSSQHLSARGSSSSAGLEAVNERLARENALLQNEVARLQSALAVSEGEAETARTRAITAEAKARSLQRQLEQCQKENKALEAALASQNNQAVAISAFSSGGDSRSSGSSSSAGLSSPFVASLSQAISDVAGALIAGGGGGGASSPAFTLSTGSGSASASNSSAVIAQLSELKRAAERMTRETRLAHEARFSAEADCQALRKRVGDLQGQLSSANQDIEDLRASVAATKRQLSSAEASLSDQRAEKDSLQRTISSLQSKVEQLSLENHRLQAQGERLSASLKEELQARLSVAEQTANDARSQAAVARAEASVLAQERDAATRQVGEAIAQRERLRSELAASSARAEEAERQVEVLRHQISLLSHQLKEANSHIAALEEEYGINTDWQALGLTPKYLRREDVQTLERGYQERVRELEDSLAGCQKTAKSLQTMVQRLGDSNRALEEKAEAAQRKLHESLLHVLRVGVPQAAMMLVNEANGSGLNSTATSLSTTAGFGVLSPPSFAAAPASAATPSSSFAPAGFDSPQPDPFSLLRAARRQGLNAAEELEKARLTGPPPPLVPSLAPLPSLASAPLSGRPPLPSAVPSVSLSAPPVPPLTSSYTLEAATTSSAERLRAEVSALAKDLEAFGEAIATVSTPAPKSARLQQQQGQSDEEKNAAFAATVGKEYQRMQQFLAEATSGSAGVGGTPLPTLMASLATGSTPHSFPQR
jgi:predicted RNase H-like nuclease (RuvC/YqgF family)